MHYKIINIFIFSYFIYKCFFLFLTNKLKLYRDIDFTLPYKNFTKKLKFFLSIK